MKQRITTILLLITCIVTLPAQAGSQAGGGELGVEQAALTGKRLERALAARGARVAIVARVGRPRDQLPEGIRYTHVAYAVYSRVRLADGRTVPGYTFYNLYQRADQPDVSDLVSDYATDFYLGAVMEETAVLIPTPEVQRRLLQVIGSPAYARLHNPHYSVIANPYDPSRQNCTEMVLDTLQTALYGEQPPARRKADLQAWFEAQPVNISPLKLLAGSIAAPGVSLADHHGEAVRTATFGSLGRYMARYHLVSEGFEIGRDGRIRYLSL